MTGDAGDARDEAERVVQLVRETSSLASCSGVVAALAAAIDRDRESNIEGHVDCSCPTCELRDALSALRARAEEEPELSGSCTCGLQAGPLLGQMHTCCRAVGHSGDHVCHCGAEFHFPEIGGELHDTEGTA